jgi:CRP/FNR family transcriptional regulator
MLEVVSPRPRLVTSKRAPAAEANHRSGQRVAATFELLQDALAPRRRLVHCGEKLYRAGERFTNLYILNSGFFKIVNVTPEGHEQVVGLKFRGDWLGFDGIATSRYACDGVATDTGEVWVIPYRHLILACAERPALMCELHVAMSLELARDRDSLMSICSLPVDARVADFLRFWAESQSRCGLRDDKVDLRMSRAEIANYLGMALETVSRSLSRLARDKMINFRDKGRRNIHIPEVNALSDFVHLCLGSASPWGSTKGGPGRGGGFQR